MLINGIVSFELGPDDLHKISRFISEENKKGCHIFLLFNGT